MTSLGSGTHRWSTEVGFDLRNLIFGVALWPSFKGANRRWWSFYLYVGPVTVTVEYHRA